MLREDRVNILLVDDQPAKLLSYEVILGDLGENLVTASSAREALEQLLKSDFAVILVDVCMPDQDGFELAEMIRAHHRFHSTAIIFVSAIQFTDMDFIKGYATGAVDYVSVPIVPEVLRAKVAIFADLYRKTRQLENMNVELEARVMQRTAKLRETEDALREADRRKDLFLATLAHELRNPLAPMQSAIDLITLLPGVDAAQRHAAQVVERQLRQMTRLIDDLMDLSRITRNGLELRRETVDLNDVVHVAIESATRAIDQANQRLEVLLPKDPICVHVDPARLSQVIANLLSNASKYTPTGGSITLTAQPRVGEVLLSVRDDGIGIAEEHLGRLFEPFYQIKDGAAEGRHGGLGIGLTLVRTIVELHGGRVSVASPGPGQGTEVTVSLPLDPSESPSLSETGKGDVRTACTRRILVVDDNLDAVETLCMVLKHLGNEVEMASDGHEALRVASAFCPEIVIMDIGMPGMDGYETIRAMRALSWTKEPHYIALTGWGQGEDRQRTAEAGFDRHLVKPVTIETFSKLLEELDSSPAVL